MKIGLDIMGGDYTPEEAIKGVRQYLDEEKVDTSVHLVLIGDQLAVQPYLPLLEPYQGRYTIVHAAQVIDMNEHPTKALKEKTQSSIVIGYGLLQAQKIDAFIGAGNTGAMMVGAIYSVKPIPGISRPTIATPIPKVDGGFNLLLDVGANADCKPEHLVQFAELGSMYVKHVWRRPQPSVGLLNLGEEEGKGNILAQATYPLLKERSTIHFVGNMEGRDILMEKADVIVCEGFVGNVILKLLESVHSLFTKVRHIQDDFLDQFDYENYGGTPILGVNHPVIIGHGISKALAFKNMIRLAEDMVRSEICQRMTEYFKQDNPSI